MGAQPGNDTPRRGSVSRYRFFRSLFIAPVESDDGARSFTVAVERCVDSGAASRASAAGRADSDDDHYPERGGPASGHLAIQDRRGARGGGTVGGVESFPSRGDGTAGSAIFSFRGDTGAAKKYCAIDRSVEGGAEIAGGRSGAGGSCARRFRGARSGGGIACFRRGT